MSSKCFLSGQDTAINHREYTGSAPGRRREYTWNTSGNPFVKEAPLAILRQTMQHPRSTSGATLFLLMLAAHLLTSQSAQACSCVAPGTPYEELQRSDLVFVGRVLSIDRSDESGYTQLEVAFQHIRSFGASSGGANVTVRTAGNSAACGFAFTKGRHYLVYASESDGQLWTSICSRTASVSRARDDLVAFNAGSLARLDDQSPRCGGPTGAAAIQSALMVVGLILVRRRRRPNAQENRARS